jgi:hypothetical protein
MLRESARSHAPRGEPRNHQSANRAQTLALHRVVGQSFETFEPLEALDGLDRGAKLLNRPAGGGRP